MIILEWLLVQYAELSAAARFLSILPLPGLSRLFDTGGRQEHSARLILGSAYFPIVGFLLALMLSLLLTLASFLFPRLVVAAFLTIALVILTGGLHLDGLMDTCDGVFGGRTHERRLEIMRDSRVGSFGVLAGACILLLKFAIFASMSTPTLRVALLTVLPCSRWAIVFALRIFPSARPDGLGITFRQTLTPARLLFAGLSALLIAVIVGHTSGVAIWLATTCIALILGAWFMDRIGGLTGDTYGAVAEISEVVGLLFMIIIL